MSTLASGSVVASTGPERVRPGQDSISDELVDPPSEGESFHACGHIIQNPELLNGDQVQWFGGQFTRAIAVNQRTGQQISVRLGAYCATCLAGEIFKPGVMKAQYVEPTTEGQSTAQPEAKS